MTEFQVVGPFGIPVYRGASGRIIRKEDGEEFFKTHQGYGDRVGCYVFGMRAGRGITPVYVGKTNRRFLAECFTSDKLTKYNRCLVDYLRGTPVMFFVVLPKKRGVDNKAHIKELEEFLIQAGVAANPDLLNVKGTKKAEWSIIGVLRTGRGKPSQAASSFKNMMKLPARR